MKKRIFCFAAAALFLCACSRQEVPAGSASSAEASASLASGNPRSGELRLLDAGGTSGYYLIGHQDGNQLLCYIDYAGAVEVPLCTSPSCAHDSESCTAWIPTEDYVSSLVCVNENAIAFIRNPASGAQTIELADASGGNRRTVYTAESGQFLQTLACADGDTLYFILETASQQAFEMWLYRVSLDGGAAEPVRKYPDLSPALQGVWKDNLVLYQFDWGDTTEEAQANGCEHRVFLWNVGTGEEQTLDTWHSDSGSIGRTLCWSDGKLWWSADNAADAIHWMDAQGGSGQTDVTWPAEITGAPEAVFTLERVVNGHALVTVWGPWGTDLLRRYAIDLSGETAGAVEIPLRFVSNASEKPIEIMGTADGELLVHFAQQETISTQVQDDGYPAKTVEIINRYGMISWDDFLAGKPNYREAAGDIGF